MYSRHFLSSEFSERFPGLVELCNYVSNAWDYEYGTPESAVAAFVGEAAELAPSAAHGITEVLTCCPDERDRLRLLGDLGWGYAPRGEGELDEFLIWTRTVLLGSAPAG